MSFPRYPSYKDSGVAWLGDVPAHWDVKRLAQCGAFLKGSGGSKEDIVEEGVPCVRYGDLYTTHSFFIRDSRTRIAPITAQNYTPIRKGDVLFAASGETFEDIGRSAVNLIDGEAYCGGDVIVLRPSVPVFSGYIGYAADSQSAAAQKAAMGRGTTIKHIYPSELKQLAIALPSVSEQMVIGSFLDRETTKIDGLIAEQERLIALLKEKRQAVVSHAVTKGLKPDAPMKPSGIEWLGDVPAHWSVVPTKFMATIGNGSTPSRDNLDYWTGGTYPWLTSTVVNQESITEADEFVTSRALEECHLPRISPPAVLVGITGQGRTRGMASTLCFEATINQHVAYLKPLTKKLDVSFLRRALDMAYPFLRRDSEAGSTKGAVTCEQIGAFKLAVPPIQEQSEIVSYIKIRGLEFDALTSEAERAVDLLQERRTALISAAVTGQIDVRGLAELRTA